MPRRRCIESRRGCSDDGYAVEGTSRCRAHTRRRACVCGAVDCQRHGGSGSAKRRSFGSGGRSGWATNPPPANRYAYRSGWQATAKRVLERDGYQCQLRYADICVGKAREVDHIIQLEAGGTDDLENLRAVCTPCHRRRTGRQGALAKQRRAAQRRQT